MRRALFALGLVALIVVLVIGLRSAPRDSGPDVRSAAPSRAEIARAFADSPAPLTRLHRSANRIVPGARKELARTLRGLRGYPVVVNLWGSWCAPCRAEFPIFQRTAVAFAKRVAFLGVLIQDKRPRAERFLREFPVTYPSIDDEHRDVSNELRAVGVPSTAFYDVRGKLAFLHQGVYRSRGDLERDISRYLGVHQALA